MAAFKYKTRGNSTPQGKSRIFFCALPEDHRTYFEEISSDILDQFNCAIWYADPDDTDTGEEEFDLSQMNLFVVPVTEKLLTGAGETIDRRFDIARKSNIPILPLIQEAGLDGLFEKKFGSLQYLDKNKTDGTAIPYSEKLHNFLSAVLYGDELAEKVRSAFDAYIFLSYRKKDREYAQKLMKLIHENDFARDVAIWYDEFLTPGEDFNELISRALEKSSLFVLAVTPNVVNEINYIMNIEYPMAVEKQKPVVPVEMVETDGGELKRLYKEIPDPVDAYDPETLGELLKKKLPGILGKQIDDPRHNFFMGLAYLSGIDVERNAKRGVELIKGAAEAGLDEAYEKLFQIYYYGDGVEQDYEEGLKWLRDLDTKFGNSIIDSYDEDQLYELDLRRMRYGELAYEAKVYDKARWAFDVCSEAAKELAFGYAHKNPIKKLFGVIKTTTGKGKYFKEGLLLSMRCDRYLLDIYAGMGMTDKAAEYGAKAANLGQLMGKLSDDKGFCKEMMKVSSRMGRICLDSGNIDGAGEWFKRQSESFIEASGDQEKLDMAELYGNYCLYYNARGDHKQASEDGESALKALSPFYEEQRNTYLLEKIIKQLFDLCDAYTGLDQKRDAAACLDDAMERIDKALEGGKDRALLEKYKNAVYIKRADLLMRWKAGDPLAQLEKGIGYFEEQSHEAVDADSTDLVVFALTRMAEYWKRQGDMQKAMDWYEKAAVFMDDTMSMTRSIGDIKQVIEVYKNLYYVYIATNNGALARKYYELTDFLLKAVEESTGLAEDAAAHREFRKHLEEAKNAPHTPVKQGDLLTWIARGDKSLEEDHPDYIKDLENGLGEICKDYWQTHRDFEGRSPISFFGQMLRKEAVTYLNMSDERREQEKRSLCGKITQSIIKSYHPFLEYEEEANLLLAYCGLYELLGAKHVLGKGGKDQALKDYGRFYYGIPFWYFPLERIKYPELWRMIYHYVTANLK